MSREAPLRALPRGMFVHVGALVVASIFAAAMWTKSKEPKALATGDVTVWSASPDAIDSVRYETKAKKVSLVAKKDATGRYFVGEVEKEAAPAADAGGESAKPEASTFVSVGAAQKIAEAFAPFKALRALGKIGDDQAGDFGLKEPEGTLTIVVGGAEHKLLVGATTPGGGDRYVRDAATNDAYAIKGDAVRDLDSAELRLPEKDLHEWKDADVGWVKIEAGDKSRNVVRGGPEGKRFWADASSPETNDETLGNWMSKLERLRPTDYAKDANGKTSVVRVEYAAPNKRPIGFVEILKAPGTNGKNDYFVVTERTRLPAKVTTSTGEQVEQDVGSIVK